MDWVWPWTISGLKNLSGWRSSRPPCSGLPPKSEVRIRQDRLTRRLPVSAPCLPSETVLCRRVSSIELVAALPESNCEALPRHRPSQNAIAPTP